MIAAYALSIAAPLQIQLGTAMTSGSPGWAALASLAVGIVAAVILIARAAGGGPEPRLAA